MNQAVQFKLAVFEGPLDLLLHLIEKSEVDIFDIPIQEITKQYLDYINEAQSMELDLASEFLVMAATLLFIKSQLLLPKPPVVENDPEWDDLYEDPRSALVQKLIEYKQFRAVAEQFRGREQFWQLLFCKDPDDLTPYRNVFELKIDAPRMHKDELLRAYLRSTRKTTSRKVVRTIQRDEISVRERMTEIEDALESNEGKIMFSQLLRVWRDRVYVITTFLAILELMKSRTIRVYQHDPYGDVVVMKREGDNPNAKG